MFCRQFTRTSITQKKKLWTKEAGTKQQSHLCCQWQFHHRLECHSDFSHRASDNTATGAVVCLWLYQMMMGCNLEVLSTISPFFIANNSLRTLVWCLTVTFSFLSLSQHSDISVGLRDVRVVIPTAVKRGDNALLICNYDMEEDSLYSIKWYKGRREFYRYTPKEPQSIKTFPVAGISVEVIVQSCASGRISAKLCTLTL